MPTLTPFRLCCYMLMTIGLLTCFSSILWYVATSDSVLNEMYIQRKGINAAHMIFRWLILTGASIAILGAVPLMIILFKKWENMPPEKTVSAQPQPSETTQNIPPSRTL